MGIKTEYIRSINSSYMQLTQTGSMEDCEVHMLLENKIYGLLPLKYMYEDERNVCRYDITGKLALDTWLRAKPLDKTIILQLLSSVCGILERIDSYLLLQQNILLAAEYIFLDHETGEFWFCYFPGNDEEPPDAFRKLLEFLLTKLNHKDEGAVELLYGVYDEALKDGYSLISIREKLHLYEAAEEEKLSEREEVVEEMPESAEKNKTENVRRRKQKDICGKGEAYRSDERRGLQLPDTVGQWKNKILEKLQPERKGLGKKYEPEPFVFEPEPEEIKRGKPTVLLSERKLEPQGIFKYIGDHHLPDIKITSNPFLIGSGENCNGRIKQTTISREHARVTQIDGVYFMEDMNSSNGTLVGGEMLSYKMKVSIQVNEIVEFADEKFRFI